MAFYRGRFIHWQLQRGASIPTWRKPRNCADARYLAFVWSKRSFASRKSLERWHAQREARERRALAQVVSRLERAMAGSPMAGSGEALARISKQHSVSPYFIVAVAATESSIGRAACGYAGRNVWGLGNCGSAWSVPSFHSWEAAYEYYARFLNDRWPGHSSPYSFRGYAACDECWARKVSSWMNSLFGAPARTTYP